MAILNALARYVAQDEKESEHICERVVPQFQHVNGSVVLAAVKVRALLSLQSTGLMAFLNTSGYYDSYAGRPTRRAHKATCS